MSDTTIRLPIAADLAQLRTKDVKWGAGWIRTVGAGFGVVIAAYGQAMDMAHVAPFQTTARKNGPATENPLDGRDPNW